MEVSCQFHVLATFHSRMEGPENWSARNNPARDRDRAAVALLTEVSLKNV
jgi:hypothetical protein